MRKLFLLLVCVLLLTGCSPVTMERQIYPICLSIDLTDTDRYQLAVQAPKAADGEQPEYAIISATGESLEEALQILSASTPYPLNFSQIRLCLVGYRLAASQPLRPLLRTVMELPTMRPTAYVSIAMESGYQVLQKQKPDFGSRLSTHINLLLDRMKEQYLLPDSSLAACVRELSDDRSDLLIGLCAVNPQLPDSPAFALGEPWSDALLPQNMQAGIIPRTGDNPVEYLGAAAVSEGRVAGILTADETQLCLRLMHECDLAVRRSGEELSLTILIPRKSDLAAHTDRVYDLVAKLQTLNSDPMLFGGACAMQFSTNEKWRQYRFRSRYQAAQVAVSLQ